MGFKLKKVNIFSLVLFLVFMTSVFAILPTNQTISKTNTQNSISIEKIFSNVGSYFKDSSQGGLFTTMSDNHVVTDNDKSIGDYIGALNAIIALYKQTNNNTYLSQVPMYVNLINKFKGTNNTYEGLKNYDWTNNSINYLTSIQMAYLISTFSNLYKVTNNQTYLNSALDIYDSLQTYFYDSIHGGYYTYLDPTSFTVVGGYLKTTGYYGIIAQSFLDLYEETLNTSILLSGFNLLNQTVNNDYSSTYNYFIPYLDQGTNSPLSSYTDFTSSQQLNMAIALLKYANLSAIQNLNGFTNQTFINISNSIYSDVINHLLYNNSLLQLAYQVSSNSVSNTAVDIGAQYQFYDFLLLRKNLGLSFSQLDHNLIGNSTALLGRFIGANSHVFLRSAYNQVTAPWYNYGVIVSFLNVQANSNTPTLTITFDTTQSMPVVGSNMISGTSTTTTNQTTSTSSGPKTSSPTHITNSLPSFEMIMLISSFIFIAFTNRFRNSFRKKR